MFLKGASHVELCQLVYEEVGEFVWSAKSFWEPSWPRLLSIHQHMPSIEGLLYQQAIVPAGQPSRAAAKPPDRILGVNTIVLPNFQIQPLLQTKSKLILR